MKIKSHDEEDMCQECMRIRQGRDFKRHFLIKPTPSRKVCDTCLEAHDKPLDAVNRSSVAESKKVRRSDSKTDPVFTKKRRDAEYLRELRDIDAGLEL